MNPVSHQSGNAMHSLRPLVAGLAVASAFLTSNAVPLQRCAAADEPAATPAQREFFEAKVRPLLAANCFKCHGPETQKGGLRLDSRATVLSGGDSGATVEPGSPENSLLIEAINYASLEMPPTGKLPDDDIATLTQWVNMGAPWPAEPSARPAAAKNFEITSEDRSYWAFQPVRIPAVPPVARADWADSPIDAFILAKLQEQGLAPNPEADKRTLIRRAHFDLIGLPPSPEDVDEFLADGSPDAFEKLIDRLLAMPQYGERWGRHWLDVVRFGQTNGYERDDEKLYAWRYRDYVIRAFNDDKPYDRFLIEQLAGDELDDSTHDSIIATGFYRLGVWDDEPDDKRQARFDELDDVVKSVGSAFLGLTLGCARCHNHMFDPIPQADYYRLAACFHGVASYGIDESSTHWKANPNAIYTPLVDKPAFEGWKQEQSRLRGEIDRIQAQVDSLTATGQNDAQKKPLEDEIKTLKQSLDKPPFDLALSVRDVDSDPQPMHVLVRGNADSPGEEVQPAVLTVLGGDSLAPASNGQGSDLTAMLRELGVKAPDGLRLAFARWAADPDNPLTARVIVNRVWQNHFGRGIVASPDNFGRAGERPTHPELLDWLAASLVRDGWSIKNLHKRIMLSKAYRMSSCVQNEQAVAKDPGNLLVWRQSLRRLDAEAIRDSLLAVAATLNPAMGGRGIFPTLPKEVLATQSMPGKGWGESDPRERARRSVYIYVKRTLMVPMLETFDYTNTSESLGIRPVTTVAPQALLLLNDPFIHEQAQHLANRAQSDSNGNLDIAISRVFALALQRAPTPQEKSIAQQLVESQPSERALISFCLVVLNLNEFVYID